MRLGVLLVGAMSMLVLASCQGSGPPGLKDRSFNDTGMYGGQKGSFPTGGKIGSGRRR